ncbi:MAG: hypothetical protein FJ357_02540 [Thaumarchaeota archaeon]|nr:hypothetical protein [Nitrososphaerota archaeon]
MNVHLGIFGAMILAMGIFASPMLASAQTHQQVVSTDIGTLKVGVLTEPASPKPGETLKMKIDFLNPQSGIIQEHIDYTVLITNGGSAVFGPIPLTHTSLGSATIPVQFKDGENKVVIEIQGILFRPIPTEKASFSIILGDKPVQSKEEPKADVKPTEQKQADKSKPSEVKDKKDLKKDSKKDKKDPKKDKKKDAKKKTVKKPVKKTES